MDTYARLGVRQVINANARLTRLGGSRMPQAVLDAMCAAAGSYVDLFELQQQVGQRLATLTNNQAAYVCTGAAAGLFLATLACAIGDDLHAIAQLPHLTGGRDEVVIHTAHRIPYDGAVRLAGVRLVTVGNVLQTFPWELEAALGPRTAAVLYIAGAHLSRGALSLPETVAIAHRHAIPVIVDAAAQLPPPENLWHFTRDCGADLAVFSGGKDLCGPQASGLIVGRADLIAACAAHGAPHQRLARPLKVGREEMVGLLVAVELYVQQDHVARLAGFETTVAWWIEQLNRLPGLHARRDFPNEAGQPIPRVFVAVDAGHAGLDAAALQQRLWQGDPRIAVGDDEQGLYLTPDTVTEDEAQTVVAQIERVLAHT